MFLRPAADAAIKSRDTFLDRVESGDASEIREVCDFCNPPEETLAQVMTILFGKGDTIEKVSRAKTVFMLEAMARADYLMAAGKFDHEDQYA